MQHSVEDLSPVKKKVSVTVSAEEVDAALDRAISQYRTRVTLPGFRKGKAPMAMVEKRFKQEVYEDAVNALINGNVGQVLKDMDVEPLGNLTFDAGDTPLARGQEFLYSFSFELMPEITLPEYDKIGVDEEPVTVEDAEIEEVIERVRRGMAQKEPVEEKRLPEDNDIVVLDFNGVDENGEAVPGVAGENFQVALGDNQVIPDFEALARTVMPGETKTGTVSFPEDYGHKPLAGKKVEMTVTVNSLMTRAFPELDEEFAKKAGGFESMDAMRDNIRDTYTRNRKEMTKAKAQSLLLESLLAKTDFPLPEGMVDRYAENMMHGRLEEMSREDKDLATLTEEDFAKLKDEVTEDAKKFVKTQLFLLTVAKKEGLEVSPQEMTVALRQIAQRGGHDLKEVQEHYARNNLFPALRDRILADKAMDRLYDKANPETPEQPAEAENAVPAEADAASNPADKADAQE